MKRDSCNNAAVAVAEWIFKDTGILDMMGCRRDHVQAIACKAHDPPPSGHSDAQAPAFVAGGSEGVEPVAAADGGNGGILMSEFKLVEKHPRQRAQSVPSCR